MTMKKILMAAVAISALTAGAANAAATTSIVSAKVSSVTLTPASTGVSATSYALASSAIIAASGQGLTNAKTTTVGDDNKIAALLSDGVQKFYSGPSGTNYSVTYTLSGTGAPTFQTAPATIKLTGHTAACATAIGVDGNVALVSGGAIGTSTITGVFNIPLACTTGLAPTGVSIDAPFTMGAVGTAIGTFSFKVVATDSVYDAPVSHPLVITGSPFTVSVATATTAAGATAKPTKLALGGTLGVYTSILDNANVDSLIGTVTYKAATAPTGAHGAVVYADMLITPLPTITADVQLNATTSNFTVIKPALSIDGGTTPSAFTVVTATPSVVSKLASSARKADISVTIGATNATSIPTAQSFTATITPYLSSAAQVTVPAAVTGALETIGVEGASFTAPWVGGSLSASSTYIRVSNSGAATGTVTVALVSPTDAASATDAGALCTSTKLAKLGSIAAGGELVLKPEDLTTCFGAFARGDVVVTVQGSAASLTAKARNVTSTNVSELSLGNGTFN